jgi:hypothetical protein
MPVEVPRHRFCLRHPHAIHTDLVGNAIDPGEKALLEFFGTGWLYARPAAGELGGKLLYRVAILADLREEPYRVVRANAGFRVAPAQPLPQLCLTHRCAGYQYVGHLRRSLTHASTNALQRPLNRRKRICGIEKLYRHPQREGLSEVMLRPEVPVEYEVFDALFISRHYDRSIEAHFAPVFTLPSATTASDGATPDP